MKQIRFWIILLTILFLCGCDRGESDMYTKIDSKQCSLHYLTEVHNYQDVVCAVECKPTIDLLNKTIKIDCVKEQENGYTVLLNTTEGYVLLWFDADEVYAYMKVIYFSDSQLETQLKNINIGTHLSTVQNIDPKGEYTFLYASSTQQSNVSYHYFKNGTYYKIFYDNSYKVTRIVSDLIQQDRKSQARSGHSQREDGSVC